MDNGTNGKQAVKVLCTILEGTSVADTIASARREAARGERDQAKFSEENFILYLVELGAGALRASVKSSLESRSARELSKELKAGAMLGALSPDLIMKIMAKHGIGGTAKQV